MSSSPDSSAAPSSVDNAPGVDLIERHRQLRARLRWLLPVGAALLLLLVYQLATLPKRAALTGYRYRQVGVQPDSTWWILAYRDSKAELLFSRDTAQGWQRRELGLDSSQARSLALNWGGKALLVGDGGAVRVYDSLFRPIDSVRYPLGRKFQARWVATNDVGQRAVVLGDSGIAFYSATGGHTWRSPVSTKRATAAYWPERAAFGVDDEIDLASRTECMKIPSYKFFIYLHGFAMDKQKNEQTIQEIIRRARREQWTVSLPAIPIIHFKSDTTGQVLLLRQDGSAESGQRHYAPTEVSNEFPAAAKPIDAAFSPSRPGFGLIISPTKVFAGQLGGPFAALTPTTEADSSIVKTDNNQPDTSIKDSSKKESDNVGKTKKATVSVQTKRVPLNSQQAKSVKQSGKTPSNTTKRDTTGDAAANARRRMQAELKSGQQNPFQQTTLPYNPAIQQAPLADDKKPQPTKENTPSKPESAR